MFNNLVGLLPLVILLMVPIPLAFSQPMDAERLSAHIHTIVVSDNEMGLEGIDITNSSQTVNGKSDILQAINSLPRGNNTEATIIVNDIVNSTEISEGDNISELERQVNDTDSGELHIDFIVLDHTEDAHQFGVIHKVN